MNAQKSPCRCGHTGDDASHPCHGKAYSCGKIAKMRFYTPHMNFALAGMQMKVSACDTWACDDCWDDFKKQLDTARKQAV